MSRNRLITVHCAGDFKLILTKFALFHVCLSLANKGERVIVRLLANSGFNFHVKNMRFYLSRVKKLVEQKPSKASVNLGCAVCCKMLGGTSLWQFLRLNYREI